MNEALSIEKATLADREIIFGLHVDSVTSLCGSHYSASQIDNWFVGRTPADYTGAIEYGGVWIAKSMGRPVGFTEVFPGLISMLYVRGDCAGKGVGKRLMDFALERARENANEIVKVEATLNAQSFYEQYGFVKVGESRLARASGIELETVLMERPVAERTTKKIHHRGTEIPRD